MQFLAKLVMQKTTFAFYTEHLPDSEDEPLSFIRMYTRV